MKDNVTLNIVSGLPENSELKHIGDGNYLFTWNLEQITYRPLVFLASDSRGATTSFVVKVQVCACVNGGLCTLEEVLSANTTVIMKCICNEGKNSIHLGTCDFTGIKLIYDDTF